MKNNPAKRYLERYRGLRAKCDELSEMIERAYEDATNKTITLKQVSVLGGGACPDRMADDVTRIVDMTNMLVQERDAVSRTLEEIMDCISSVPDEVQQTVLIGKYINGKTFEEIRQKIGYEISNTYVIHGKALLNVLKYMVSHGIGVSE